MAGLSQIKYWHGWHGVRISQARIEANGFLRYLAIFGMDIRMRYLECTTRTVQEAPRFNLAVLITVSLAENESGSTLASSQGWIR